MTARAVRALATGLTHHNAGALPGSGHTRACAGGSSHTRPMPDAHCWRDRQTAVPPPKTPSMAGERVLAGSRVSFKATKATWLHSPECPRQTAGVQGTDCGCRAGPRGARLTLACTHTHTQDTHTHTHTASRFQALHIFPKGRLSHVMITHSAIADGSETEY